MWTLLLVRKPWLLAGSFLLFSLFGTSQAEAQRRSRTEVSAEQTREAEARALFEAGRAHAEGERWVEALDAFQRSRAVVERPSILFNIATTLIRLGRAQEALAAIADLERLADVATPAAMLENARTIRAQAEASLRHVVLQVTPAAAEVEIDGQVLSGEGAERAVTLDPGPHQIVVSLDGYETVRLALEPGADAHAISLVAHDGVLNIVPNVEDAAVLLNGEARGQGTMRLTVRPGTYAITIRAPGHISYERSFDVAPGAELTVDATLELLPRPEELYESPIFWGVGVGTLALAGVGVVLGIVLGTTTLPVSGGSTDTIIAPLTLGSFE
jgi:hypothetical protein